MAFGNAVIDLSAGQVDATTLVPCSKASARNEIQAQLLLAELIAVAAASGGTITLTFAATGSGAGNDVVIKGSSAGSGATAGGDVVIEPGTKSGAGADGVMVVRQPGGTPGTDEVWLRYSGTFLNLVNAAGIGFGGLFLGPSNNLISFGGSTDSFPAFRNVSTQIQAVLAAQGDFADFLAKTYQVGSTDAGMNRAAAAVVNANDGTTGPGWFRSSAGHLMANTSPTNNTATLASTNLAWTLIAGRSYSIKGKISGGNSTATEGFQFALTADGTLTATTIDLTVIGTRGTVVAGTQRVTALGSAITFTTFTAPSDVYFVGEIKCGVSGVMTLQFAEATTAVGTATLNAGSWVELNDSRAV